MSQQAIPLLCTIGYQSGDKSYWAGSLGMWVNPQPGNNTSPEISSHAVKPTETLRYAVVLSRADPTAKPLFNANLPNNTDIPAALAPLLTSQNILFFYTVCWTKDAPQGALYDVLRQNGGGQALEQFENLVSWNGCGMQGNVWYLQVGIPGSGIAGVERHGFQQYTYGTQWQDPEPVRGSQSGYERLFFTLVPSPSGYAPVLAP